MLFSELYKIMVKQVPFVDLRGGDRPYRPPCICPLIAHNLRMRLRIKPRKTRNSDVVSQIFGTAHTRVEQVWSLQQLLKLSIQGIVAS